MDANKIRLTQTVKKGGCAAKLPAGTLREVLKKLPALKQKPRELITGFENLDDAALWDLDDGRLLVQTLDFFTPIVDDAYDFGAIAATNALSDVYAMGGMPKTAMTILAFPVATLSTEILLEIMQGATEQIHKAGASLVGGHSIDDDTLKLGFSVSGFVSKERAWTNAGAKTGDVLILTKGLGTGTLCAKLKFDQLDEKTYSSLKSSMTQLNQAPETLGDLCSSVHAATDITGFGLLGHSLQMAEASGVSLEIDFSKIPALLGAMGSLEEEYLTKAHQTNWVYAQNKVKLGSALTEPQRLLLCDPQTSGGLLLSVSADKADEVLSTLQPHFLATAKIGVVSAAGDYRVGVNQSS